MTREQLLELAVVDLALANAQLNKDLKEENKAAKQYAKWWQDERIQREKLEDKLKS